MSKRVHLILLALVLGACSREPVPGSVSKSDCVRFYMPETRNEAGAYLVDLMCTQYSRPAALGDYDLASCVRPNIGTVKDRTHAKAITRACR